MFWLWIVPMIISLTYLIWEASKESMDWFPFIFCCLLCIVPLINVGIVIGIFRETIINILD
jgi:hypothetical protein